MLKVLIAEDDIIGRKLLEKIFSQYGDCDLVINGEEAVDAYKLALKKRALYDLICLDVLMPKVDGITVHKTIRDLELQNKITKKAKIIMLTAYSESEIDNSTFVNKLDSFLMKPIDINKLIKVLNDLDLL